MSLTSNITFFYLHMVPLDVHYTSFLAHVLDVHRVCKVNKVVKLHLRAVPAWKKSLIFHEITKRSQLPPQQLRINQNFQP